MKPMTNIHSQYGTVHFNYSIDRDNKIIRVEGLSEGSDGSYSGQDLTFLQIGIELHRFIQEGYVFDCKKMVGKRVSQFIERFTGILRAYKTVKNVTDRIFAPDGIII